MSFIRTGFREIGLKVRRQKTRMALRHEKRVLQKSEIALGREGCLAGGQFSRSCAMKSSRSRSSSRSKRKSRVRIAQIEEGIKQIEAQRQENATEQNEALAALEEEKKPDPPAAQSRPSPPPTLCDRELAGVDRRLQDNDAADRELLQKLTELQAQVPPPADLDAQTAGLSTRRVQLPEQRAEITRARIGSAEACRQRERETHACRRRSWTRSTKKIAALRERI